MDCDPTSSCPSLSCSSVQAYHTLFFPRLQFQDSDFGSLSGARVVRIATHPDYQGMGYGSRALELLEKYYLGKMTSLTETENPLPTQEAHTVDDQVCS